MKRLICLAATAAMATMLTAGAGLNDEKVLLVKITGIDRADTYQIMTPEELDKLEGLLKLESSLYRKSLEMARDKWKEDETVAGTPFPSAAVSTRRVRTVGTYSDSKSAKEKLDYLEAKIAESQQRDEEREAERLKQKHTRVSWNLDRQERRERVDKAAIAREHAREATKEELYVKAQTVYDSCLQELVAEKQAQIQAQLDAQAEALAKRQAQILGK